MTGAVLLLFDIRTFRDDNSAMSHFCTYFDHNYLPRGLVLYHSLKRHCPDAILHVLALSSQCAEQLGKLNLPDVNVTRLEHLEQSDPALLVAKANRSIVEYYFTLSPCWPLYLLEQVPEIDLLTYMDSDMALFADPMPVLAEMEGRSIGVVGHRFPEKRRYLERFGRYNVGWLSYRNDAEAKACLHWWREKCLEWCCDYLDGDRYADQKYLDQWPQLFPNMLELQHKGVNVAPWNVDGVTLSLQEDRVMVDEQPLVCYHFQGVKPLWSKWWSLGLAPYRCRLTTVLAEAVYHPYLQALTEQAAEQSLRAGGIRHMGWKKMALAVKSLLMGDTVRI